MGDILSEKEVMSMDKGVGRWVSEETKLAEKSSVPQSTLGTLFEDVFVRGSEPAQRRRRTVHEASY